MQQTPSSARHPLIALIYLVFLAFAGSLVFGALSIGAGMLLYGQNLTIQAAVLGNDPQSIGFMKIFELFSGIGMFIVPSLVFAKMESGHVNAYLKLNVLVPLLSVILAVVIIFACSPFLEFFIRLNGNMRLPGALKQVEDWMRFKEDELAGLTEKLLTMRTRLDLNVNLLMIAAVPAIGEEFFFRGCIQQIISRWVKSDHLAIWITAIIFSAIHLQFFGFIPRMLLGALLGYLFVWGKSIWLPVLAHFTNNAVSVIASYIYQQKGQSPGAFEDPGPANTWLCVASALLTAVLLYAYWRSAKTGSLIDHHEDGE